MWATCAALDGVGLLSQWSSEVLRERVEQLPGAFLALLRVVVSVEEGTLFGVDEVGAIAVVVEFDGGD
jgi:hypothetical protein